jgi:hypothetical protein
MGQGIEITIIMIIQQTENLPNNFAGQREKIHAESDQLIVGQKEIF